MAVKEKGRQVEQRRRAQKTFDDDLGMQYLMRVPKPPTAFEVFAATLPDEQQPFRYTYWHMQCKHTHEEQLVTAPNGDGPEPVFVRCLDCDLVRRWQGSRTATKKHEWMSYCPDGFDMFEWDELFTRDREMWRFIHDEVLVVMVEDALTEEAA